MPEFIINSEMSIVDCLLEAGLEKSKGAIRRLITQNAISVDGEKIQEDYIINKECVIRMGKLKFLRIKK